jgi:hypothetical protein
MQLVVPSLVCVCACVNLCICMYVTCGANFWNDVSSTCMHMFVCICIAQRQWYIYIYMYVSMYLCIYVSMYIYIHIHTYIHTYIAQAPQEAICMYTYMHRKRTETT